MPSMSNEIYSIHENESALKYQINFGNRWPDESYLKSKKGKHPFGIVQDLLKDNYVAFLNYLESSDVLHLNFSYDSRNYSFYYNRSSGQSTLFYTTNKDITFPLTTIGNTFVCVQYVEDKNPVLIFFDVAW